MSSPKNTISRYVMIYCGLCLVLISVSCDNHKQVKSSSVVQEEKSFSDDKKDSIAQDISVMYSEKDILNRNLLSFSDSVLNKKTIIHSDSETTMYPTPQNSLDSILVYSPVNYQGNRTIFTKAVYNDSTKANEAFNRLISEKDSFSGRFKYGVLIFTKQNYVIYLNKECFSPPAFKTWKKYQQEFLNQILNTGEIIKAINAECGAMEFEIINVKSPISFSLNKLYQNII